MSDLRALPVGTELVGDYRIRRVLGAGGFGITYLAEEPSLARLVTIKEYFPSDFAARDKANEAVPRSQNCADDYQWGLDRFIDEAQALAKFDHPNIVRVYRYFRLHKTGYMVLQFEEGASLKAWLKNLRRAPRQNELDAIIAPLLDALELIHKADFLHRDIAPDNIIIRKDGDPVLIDFGSARGQIAQHSKTISALVKPGYSPYEQYAMTSRNQGPWTDIYSLGATLYLAICGRRPIDAPSRIVADELQSARDVALSSYRPGFLAAIDKALRLDVRQRPQSIATWRDELLAPASAPLPTASASHATPVSPVQSRPSPAAQPSTQALHGADQAHALRQAQRAGSNKAQNAPPVSARHAPPPQNAPRPAPAPHTNQVPQRDRAENAAAQTEVLSKNANASATRRGLLNLFNGAKQKAASAGKSAQQVPAAATASPASPPRARAKPKVAAKPARPKPAKKPAPAKARAKPAPKRARKSLSKSARDLVRRTPKRKPPQPHRIRKKSAFGWRSLAVKLLIGVGVASAAVAMQDRLPQLQTRGSGILSSQRTDITLVNHIRAHTGNARAVSFIHGGTQLVSTGADAAIKLWDAATGALIRTIELDDGPATAFATQYGRAVTGHKDGTIALWDLTSGTKVTSFKRNDANIWSLTFLGDSGRIAAAAHDWSVTVWDERKAGEPLHVFKGHENAAQAIAFSNERNALASGGADEVVKLWNTSSMKPVRTYRNLSDFVTSISFSPDGRNFAAATLDGNIKIFSARSKRKRRTLRGHDQRVTALAYTPGGKYIASASVDGTARLWKSSNGRTIKTFRTNAGPLNALALSPDGHHLATASQDGGLRIWNISQFTSAKKKRK